MAKMYLYNGVELPELPEFDQTTFKRMAIGKYTNGSTTVYLLMVSTEAILRHTSATTPKYVTMGIEGPGKYMRCTCVEGKTAWGSFGTVQTVESGYTAYLSATPFWANHTVYGYRYFPSDPLITYVTASEPVPVTPTIPVLTPASMLPGLLAGRRIAGQRGKA